MFDEDEYNEYQVYIGQRGNYFTDESINQSSLKEFIEDPNMFWERSILNPNRVERPKSTAMARGTLYHTIIESTLRKNHDVFKYYHIEDTPRLTQKLRKELEKEYPNKIIIKLKEYEQLSEAVTKLLIHPLVSDLIDSRYSNFEQEVYWSEPITEGRGVYMLNCKAKLDYYNHDVLIDWKSTRARSYDEFEMEVRKYKYFMQAAWYSRALMRLDNYLRMSENEIEEVSPLGESIINRKYMIIAQNLTEPDIIIPYTFDPEDIEIIDDNIMCLELPDLRKFIVAKKRELLSSQGLKQCS